MSSRHTNLNVSFTASDVKRMQETASAALIGGKTVISDAVTARMNWVHNLTFEEIAAAGVSGMVDNDGAYCERIDIMPEFRRCGHGTEALRELSRIYGGLTIAPDNEDARRLYDRIGNEITAEYIDQGYGVYQI